MFTCAFLLFLDGSMHLYKRVCLSVRPSVHHAFSKNPRKHLFLVAYDIRINGRTSRNLFHTHTCTHALACTWTRPWMKSIRLRNPDDERLQNTHTHTHTQAHTHTSTHVHTHTRRAYTQTSSRNYGKAAA